MDEYDDCEDDCSCCSSENEVCGNTGGGGGIGGGTGSTNTTPVGLINTFMSAQLYTEELLCTTVGSSYVSTNLYVDGLIYCNGIERLYVGGSTSSNNNTGGVGTGTAGGGITSITVVGGPSNRVGVIEPFAAAQPYSEEMLSTTEGSHLIGSNLYVNGLIYCNGIEQIFVASAGGGVGDPGSSNVGSSNNYKGSNIEFYKTPICFSDLYIDKIHFLADFGSTSNNDPVIFTPPLSNASNVLLPDGLYYDNAWTLLRIPSSNLKHHHHHCKSAKEDAAIVSNGKLCVSCDPVDTPMVGASKVLYNGPVVSHLGDYAGNAYTSFNPFSIELFEKKDAHVAIQSQSLNMHTGILKTEGIVEGLVKTSCDVFVARHLPYCIVQSLRLTPNTDMRSLLVSHSVSSMACMTNIEFSNSTIHVPEGKQKLDVMISQGDHPDIGRVACISSYVFDGCIHESLGMNINCRRTKTKGSTNLFELFMLKPNVASRMHVVHVLIASSDSKDPVEEARRITLTILGRDTSLPKSVCRLREDHVKAWADVWKTNITLTPKCAGSNDQKILGAAFKKHLRYNLYQIWSLTRMSMAARDQKDYPMLDVLSTALPGSDLFMLPLMTTLKPEVALSFLEYRYKNLEEAMRLAEAHGSEGAKIPFYNSASGNSVVKGCGSQWDSASAMTVFNSALTVVSTWSCYRLLLNKDWLRNKGYAMMTAIATFLSNSVLERSSHNSHGDEGDTRDDRGRRIWSHHHHHSNFYTPKTYGVSGIESHEDNAFTNRSIVLAMKAVIEASWELNLTPDERWVAIFHRLPIPKFCDRVPKFDACSKDADTYDILEPLLLGIPSYVNEVDCVNLSGLLLRYTLQKTTRKNHPLNLALLAICSARKAQEDPMYLEQFEQHINAFIRATAGPIWGGFCDGNCGGGLDPLLSAMFISIITQGFVNLRVAGGVAETRFYYEEMRLTSAITANMPRYWDKISVTGVGARQHQCFKTLNNVLL